MIYLNSQDIHNISIIFFFFNKQLTTEIKKQLEKIGKNNLDKVLYKHIIKISNYNVDSNAMLLVIIDFCAQFGFNNDLKEYFINLIDSSQYKNYLYKKEKKSLKDNNKYNNETLICILSNVFIFLPIKERIKIISLQKKIEFNWTQKKYIHNHIKKKKFIFTK